MARSSKYQTFVDEKNKRVYAVQKHRPETLVHYVAKQFGVSDARRKQYVFNKEHGIEDSLDITLCLDKLFIASQHKAIVQCDPRDTFDAEKGKELAIAKLDATVAKAKEKALTRWQEAMTYKIIKISNRTFGAGYDKAIAKLIDEDEIELEIEDEDDTCESDGLSEGAK